MTEPSAPQSIVAYQHPAEHVVAELDTNASSGLTQAEAQRRLQQYGLNQLETAKAAPWWQLLLEQFRDTLVIILLIATVISFVEWFLQNPKETPLPYEGLVILSIVILNALLGYFQEARAERAVQALMEMAAPESTVIRDGQRLRVPSHDLVPGDILLLEAGDRIPADARLLESANFKVDEAALTGESLPASKTTAVVKGEASLGDRINMVFAGTVATYGRGRAAVVATGMRTEVGRIASLIEGATKEATPLQQELDRTGKRLTVIMLVICAVVFVTSILIQGARDLASILQLFLFAVALAVAAIPEALPAVVTAGLAIGVRRMAAANALIRKLPAVETLGAASVICTDKTGTLTRNEMTVRKVFTADTVVDVSGSGYNPKGEFTIGSQPVAELPAPVRIDLEKTLRAGALANDANLRHDGERWLVQGDPTEGALVVAAQKYGLPERELNQRFPRLGEVPFTSERKRHTTIHGDLAHADQLRVFVKGAPDVILNLCDTIRQEDRVVPLTDERRAQIMAENEQLASQALRTLAMAERILDRQMFGIAEQGPDSSTTEVRQALEQLSEQQIERDLTFLGIAGMIDPPRAEARDAVQVAQHAGIRTVMITGDHPGTASAIARELGILADGSRTMRGADLTDLDDPSLDQIVEQTSVYARVDPEHKLRIVESWQRRGRVVAMTGDGINDAPALRTANIGVAMGITGTDVSKEAADMVLADDNFASIVHAVEEGRGIFDNIRKYLYYLLSCNAGEIMTMFLGVALAGVLGLVPPEGVGFFLPLTAAQLLWINLITDGPPALALGLDPKSPDVMDRPPRQQRRGIISRRGWLMIGGMGLVMTIGTLFVLDGAYPGGLTDMFVRYRDDLDLAEHHARTLAFSTLVLFQLFNVLNNRSFVESAFVRLFENKLLWAAIALSLLLQLAVVYVPFLQTAFFTTALTAGDWLVAVLVASSGLVIAEIAKLLTRRQERALHSTRSAAH